MAYLSYHIILDFTIHFKKNRRKRCFNFKSSAQSDVQGSSRAKTDPSDWVSSGDSPVFVQKNDVFYTKRLEKSVRSRPPLTSVVQKFSFYTNGRKCKKFYAHYTKVFANFLSTTLKLRVSFSSADEQFQAEQVAECHL